MLKNPSTEEYIKSIKRTMDNYDLAIDDIIKKVKKKRQNTFTKKEIVILLEESKMNFDDKMNKK